MRQVFGLWNYIFVQHAQGITVVVMRDGTCRARGFSCKSGNNFDGRVLNLVIDGKIESLTLG